MITTIISENPVEAAKKAAETIVREGIGGEVLFLSSGGSALRVIDYLDREVVARWTVGVIDERYEGLGNFEELRKKINVAHIDRATFINIAQSSLIASVDYFEKQLRQWKNDNPDGKIVVTLGIGSDGHTAGIMVGHDQAMFDDPNHWVTGYDAGPALSPPLRITTTFPFLRLVDCAVVYVCGQGKKGILEKTLASTGSLIETPARIIGEIPRVFLFTDIHI